MESNTKLKDELTHYEAGIVALQDVLPCAFGENFEPFFFSLFKKLFNVFSFNNPSVGLIPIPSCEAIKFK